MFKSLIHFATLVVLLDSVLVKAFYKRVFYGGGEVDGKTALECIRRCRTANCTFSVNQQGECVVPASPVNSTTSFGLKYHCFGESCYYFPASHVRAKKAGAVEACAAENMHLWAPNSQQETDDVFAFMAAHPEIEPLTPIIFGGAPTWIDLVDDSTWSYNGLTADWTNWEVGEPSHAAETDAIVIYSTGKWCDALNLADFYFICEKEIN